MERKFPIKPSPPDERDFNLMKLFSLTVTPPEKKNSQHCSPSEEQGEFGLCWSFMMDSIINYYCNKYRLNSKHRLSPLYIAQAVKTSDYCDYPEIEGESIRAAVKGGQKAGTVAWSRYPYEAYQGDLKFPPTVESFALVAERFKIGPYAKVTTVEEIKQSLNAEKPVASGILWTDRFFDKNWLDWPFGKVVGGHAIPLYDYSDTLTKWGRTGWVKFQNSWGEDWCDEKGFGYVSYDYLRHVTDQQPFLIDAYSIDFINTNIPAYNVNLQIDSKDAYADDIHYVLDQPPIIDASTGRTLLPVRAIADMAGYQVSWDGTTRRINLRK